MVQRAVQEFKGPVNLDGLGDVTTKSDRGIYQAKMLLHNGENATMSGFCVTKSVYNISGILSPQVKA